MPSQKATYTDIHHFLCLVSFNLDVDAGKSLSDKNQTQQVHDHTLQLRKRKRTRSSHNCLSRGGKPKSLDEWRRKGKDELLSMDEYGEGRRWLGFLMHESTAQSEDSICFGARSKPARCAASPDRIPGRDTHRGHLGRPEQPTGISLGGRLWDVECGGRGGGGGGGLEGGQPSSHAGIESGQRRINFRNCQDDLISARRRLGEA